MPNEIIIDGVNVAECEMLCDGCECALYYAELSNDKQELEFGYKCQDNNCHYKQLQRLKQENTQLKQKNEELLQSENRLKERLKKMNLAWAKDINKHLKQHQALKDIKEIAENAITFCEKCSKEADYQHDCIDCTEGGEALLARRVMVKVKEVIDE